MRLTLRALAPLYALLALTLCGVLASPARAESRYPFAVSAEREGSEFNLIARNKGPAPVSVRITPVNSVNLASDRPWPLYANVPPQDELSLARLSAAQPGQSMRFSFRVVSRTGHTEARHDPEARYRLPYPNGQTYVVSQAFGGPSRTHTSPDSLYAVDFTMPEGTPIVAARAGVVIETEDSYQRSGNDSTLLGQANRVRILHADGTIGTYSHLSFRGVRVQVGEKVEAGRFIGFSGSTGYSSGPHLHFVVHELSRTDDGFAYIAVPIRFYVGDPAHVFDPQYLHMPTADYATPGREPPFYKIKRAEAAR